jgi:uncharacterized protein (DUF1697 family)
VLRARQFLVNLAFVRERVLITYAAFLRGINVGGNKLIKMADVKKAFVSLGFRDVSTVGASGNIIFASPSTDSAEIAETIKTGLDKALGLGASVIIRSMDQLREFIELDPFRTVKITPEIRLYVTFLAAPTQSKSRISLPYAGPKKIFQVLKLTKTEIFTVVDLSTGGSTLDAMGFVEKEFGKNVTTRNWNTIKKIAG